MRIAALIARILLGLMFVVFGSNGFLHFIPMGPLPPGPAGQFSTILFQSHYFFVVGLLQFAGGLLLLINRYVALGLVILGPIIVNILLYHLLLFRQGLILAIVVALLWAIVAFYHRRAFDGIFTPRLT
jgi:putative oxidoreductase